MYHLIFVVKIKINMRVCIFGSGLSALTLAKALVKEKINVDLIYSNIKIKLTNLEHLVSQKVILTILIQI